MSDSAPSCLLPHLYCIYLSLDPLGERAERGRAGGGWVRGGGRGGMCERGRAGGGWVRGGGRGGGDG